MRSICTLIFVVYCCIIKGQQAMPAETYQQAERMLSFNTSALVDRMFVKPNWQSDDQFWYCNLFADGKEYVVYDIQEQSQVKYGRREDIPGFVEETPKHNPNLEVLSPDGTKAVFLRNWNLWMRDVNSGTEKQLTFDGIQNFGYATDNAGWRQSERPVIIWSSDSKKVATFQQDQRHVSSMYLVTTNVGEPKLKSWKYPLPQDEEIIKIHRIIIEVDGPNVIRLDLPPDPRRGTLCDDISCTGKFDDNQWSADGSQLMFVSTSRDHKIAELRLADASSGKVRDILKEEVETQYESGQGEINWHWLEKEQAVIWYSERDNWGHLYLYEVPSGQLRHQITKGNFVVTRLLHVDEATGVLFFEANGKEAGRDPYFSHLYRIDLSGDNLELLTPEDGHHQIYFSPGNKYFIDNYSQPDIPPVSVLRDLDGKLLDTVELADISRLLAVGWKPPEPITVKSFGDTYDLYGLMYTPTDLDSSKKYPIINYIYPGPQGGSVGSRAFDPGRRDHQALAELGFVVVAIDGTCNPGRSKAFHDLCYGEMGTNTLPDQVYGMQQLAERYVFIDLQKVGIWGHSGGGFATAAAMFTYPEFFDVGIAESGNHDNRNYEDDWGERYIGLLQEDDSTDNYAAQANQLYAQNLKGKLLLAHGGMDDNVPPYHTYLVVDALIKANKDFDLLILPNARHGFGSDGFYMMRRRWDYFVKHLLHLEPPKEYKIKYQPDPRVSGT